MTSCPINRDEKDESSAAASSAVSGKVCCCVNIMDVFFYFKSYPPSAWLEDSGWIQCRALHTIQERPVNSFDAAGSLSAEEVASRFMTGQKLHRKKNPGGSGELP